MLAESGLPYERREFFKVPLTVDELRSLLAGVGLTPRGVLSRRSRVYRERAAEIDQLDDEALLDLMVREPTLLRRPLVTDGTTIIVGHNPAALRDMIVRHRPEGRDLPSTAGPKG